MAETGPGDAVTDLQHRSLDLIDGEIRAAGRPETVDDVIRVGGLLNEAKKQLKHGQWLPWLLRREFGYTPRTAQHYMRAHEVARDRNDPSDFKLMPTALYRIAKADRRPSPQSRRAHEERPGPEGQATTALAPPLAGAAPTPEPASIARDRKKFAAAAMALTSLATQSPGKFVDVVPEDRLRTAVDFLNGVVGPRGSA